MSLCADCEERKAIYMCKDCEMELCDECADGTHDCFEARVDELQDTLFIPLVERKGVKK